MDLFFRSASQQKTYKITPAEEVCYIYYVQVSSTCHAFTHARGRDYVQDLEKARELMQALDATPIQEQDYINALKDYFAIDKNVREQFIQNYKLK